MQKTIFRNKKTKEDFCLETAFNVGDVVKIENLGQVYPTYGDAISLFKDIYPFKNADYLKGEITALGMTPNYTTQQIKQLKWIVLGKCKHAYGDYVLYLIFNPIIKYGFVIGEEGIYLHQPYPRPYQKSLNFYVAN